MNKATSSILAVFIVFSFVLGSQLASLGSQASASTDDTSRNIAVAPDPDCEVLYRNCPDDGNCNLPDLCVTPEPGITLYPQITITPTPTTVPPTATPVPDDIQACNSSGGYWQSFPDSCADTCRGDAFPDEACLAVFTNSCNCGKNKCWDGKTCRPNPIITPTPKPTLIPIPTLRITIVPTNTPTPSPTTKPTLPPDDGCAPPPSCLNDQKRPCTPTKPQKGWCKSADFDFDGDVDKDDYYFMKERFFKRDGKALQADITGDGRVDLEDYSILVHQMHSESTMVK